MGIQKFVLRGIKSFFRSIRALTEINNIVENIMTLIYRTIIADDRSI